MMYILIENVFKNMNGLAGSVKKSFRLHPDEFDLIAVSEKFDSDFFVLYELCDDFLTRRGFKVFIFALSTLESTGSDFLSALPLC